MASIQVVEALCKACHGTSPAEQISAMKFLHDIEGREGVVCKLFEVVQNTGHTHSDDSRLMATICLKNNVDRCWISRGENYCIPDVEKDVLRNEIFSLMGEDNDKISIQLAVLAARIARHDFPHQWPRLFDTIFEQFDSGDWITCTHAVTSLLQVMLTLHAKRLSRDRTQFRQVCTTIIEPFYTLWNSICSQFLLLDWQSVEPNVASAIGAHTNLLCTCSRILQIMIMQCFEEMHGDVFMQSMLVSIANTIEKIGFVFSQLFAGTAIEFVFSVDHGRSRDIWATVSTWREDSSVDSGLPMHGSVCLGYGVDSLDIDATIEVSGLSSELGREGRVYVIATGLCLCRAQMSLAVIPLHMQKDCNRDLMTPFVSYYLRLYYCLLLENGSSPSSLKACEPLAVTFALFLSNTISACTGLDPTAPLCQFFLENVEGNDESEGKSRLGVILELVVNKLMQLPQATLCAWNDDPEELFASVQVASEGDNMRYAAEGLYSSMLYFCPDQVCPAIVGIMSDYQQQLTLSTVAANDPLNSVVLFWDSVYTCSGLSPYFISQQCDISQWARDVLGPLLLSLLHIDSTPQILQYRLIWVCGCWCNNLEKDILSELIRLIVQYLKKRPDGTSADLLLRLQVISTVETILRSENFDYEMILPVVDDLFSDGCAIIGEVSDDSTKVSVVSLFQDIVESMGPACGSSVPRLLQYAYWLWEQTCGGGSGSKEDRDFDNDEDSDDSCVLLSQLLSLFAALAKIITSSNRDLLPVPADSVMRKFLTIADFATGCDDNLDHLSPEGIALWRVVLRSAHSVDDELGLLFVRNIPNLVGAGALGSCFKDISNFLFLLEEYVMKGGPGFLSDPSVVSVLTRTSSYLIENVKSNVIGHTFRIMHFMLLGSESDALTKSFVSEGIIYRIVRVCAASLNGATASDALRPVFVHIAKCNEAFFEPESVTASYLCFFARVGATYPDLILGTCQEIACDASSDFSGEIVVKGILRLIIDKFDTIACTPGGLWHSRVCCLCLLSMYPTNDSDLLDWFQELLYIVDGIVLAEPGGGESAFDTMLANVIGQDVESFDDDEFIDCTDGEKVENEFDIVLMKTMFSWDFAVTTSIQNVACEKIKLLQEQFGSTLLLNMLSAVDKDVLDRITTSSSS